MSPVNRSNRTPEHLTITDKNADKRIECTWTNIWEYDSFFVWSISWWGGKSLNMISKWDVLDFSDENIIQNWLKSYSIYTYIYNSICNYVGNSIEKSSVIHKRSLTTIYVINEDIRLTIFDQLLLSKFDKIRGTFSLLSIAYINHTL